ncbi:MAG: DUF721 domain-containing protein [Pirellulales bacterium]|nr:DUF721 domain-containing protein [Pirellulales bacterium]
MRDLNDDTIDHFEGFQDRRRREQRSSYFREPKRAKEIMAAVMRRHGYGNVLTLNQYHAVLQNTVGDMLSSFVRVVGLSRGRLEVVVANSTVLQELAFYRKKILEALADAIPDGSIQDIRFRIGPVDTEAD